jgi:hypothetical protein
MKLESNNLLEKLSSADLKILTTEVNETLDKSFKRERKRNFSAVDLWNIHRNRRNLFLKRMSF